MRESQTMVLPLGRGNRPRPLRRFRVRPASTLKDEHEQVLALVAQNFCRLFSADLSTFVRGEVTVSMAPIQQWSWDDLLSSLPEPYCAVRLAMPPMTGTGLIAMEVPLAIAIVEKLLGGAGLAQERTEPLTEVELSLLGELQKRAAGDMAEALALVVETRPVAARQESRLELIRAATAGSLLIALECDIDIMSAQGHFRVAIPAEALVARLDAFSGSVGGSTATVADTGKLGECSVEATVRFNDTILASHRVVDLVPGQLLRLNHPVSEPLTLYVGDQPFLAVLAGRRGTQKAFAVVGPRGMKGTEL